MKNDLTLLRPFNLRSVSQGDGVCDSRGRELTIDGAAELVQQAGIGALRMLPEMWLNGAPVYWDSLVQTPFGVRKYEEVSSLSDVLGWPTQVPEQVLELYIDGKRVDTFTLPATANLVYWRIAYDFLGAQYAAESENCASKPAL